MSNHIQLTSHNFTDQPMPLAANQEPGAEALLLMKQALVLYGVPGTSKTHFAVNELLPSVTNKNHVKNIQFHSGYSYADLMIGITPESDPAKKSTRAFSVKPGILYRLAAEAANALTNYGVDTFGDGTRDLRLESKPETDDEIDVDMRKPIRYVLLIDEINRADLARVFGEVMYCIEYRGKEATIQLPHVLPNGTVAVESALTPGKMVADPFDGGRNFYLPKNLYIVGTMNQADRSIGAFDAALRRRFAWYPMNFSPVRLHAMLLGHGVDPKAIEAFVALASRLNAMIAAGTALSGILKLPLSAEHTIGHTYFAEVHKIMKRSGQSQNAITPLHRERLWLYSIGPLLEDALGYEAQIHAMALNELKNFFVGKQS